MQKCHYPHPNPKHKPTQIPGSRDEFVLLAGVKVGLGLQELVDAGVQNLGQTGASAAQRQGRKKEGRDGI